VARRETRIALLVPFDTSNDRELWRWCPDGATLLITRTGFHDGLLGMALAEATADADDVRFATRSVIAPEPDVVTFACTSGSFVQGLRGERALHAAMADAGARRTTTTSGSMLDAFAALGLRRVALATPYPADIGEKLVDFVEEAGYRAASLENLGLPHGEAIQSTTDDEIIELARAADRPDADAIFLSCTGLGTLDLVARAEARLGKPVLTAIQVTMWGALRAVGLRPPVGGQALLASSTGVPA
jgi:maleate isomerase